MHNFWHAYIIQSQSVALVVKPNISAGLYVPFPLFNFIFASDQNIKNIYR